MAWIGTITDVGRELLIAWTGESLLSFEGAQAGQGFVDESLLASQTVLVSKRQDGGIIDKETVKDGIRLKIRFTAASESYKMTQIGVFARVAAGDSALLALFQQTEGVPIPAFSESPDFAYTFYALITCSNEGKWTVLLDTAALATQEDIRNAIVASEERTDAKLSQLSSSLTALREESEAKAEQLEAALEDGLEALRGEMEDAAGRLEESFAAELGELTARVAENESKLLTLWDAVFTNITGNPFTVVLSSLDGLTVTAGVYNAAKSRLEC